MSNLEPLLERNRAFATGGTYEGLTPIPKHQLFVVTCLDARVDPAHVLGAELGDALVMRNAGGRVNDEVIREIAFIGAVTDMMFGGEGPPFEVAVIHHTSCGTGFLADDDFRTSFAERVDADPEELADQAVTDPTESVLADVKLLLDSPYVPDRVRVSGHVYDVESGLVTTVAEPQ